MNGFEIKANYRVIVYAVSACCRLLVQLLELGLEVLFGKYLWRVAKSVFNFSVDKQIGLAMPPVNVFRLFTN